MIPVIGFMGYSNSGKTTVVSKLIDILTKMGYRVAAVKHAAHGYDLDVPGKDSWQHYNAGAQKVILVGPDSITSHERCLNEPKLQDVLQQINNVDCILVEGFKGEPGPKIEIVRDPDNPRVPAGHDLAAIISDLPLGGDVPVFAVDQLETLAAFIIDHFNIKKSRS